MGLIGAVTHVLISDPSKRIWGAREVMLEEAGLLSGRRSFSGILSDVYGNRI